MAVEVSAGNLRTRMQNIDPYEFEHFVAELWKAQGWDTEVSQASNDMGVDITAWKFDGLVDQKIVIQAKRYAEDNKIGRPAIQQYHSLKQQDSEVDAAVVVTTSSYTSSAKDWANEHNVKLIDGDDLVNLVLDQRRYDLLDEYAPTLSEISGSLNGQGSSEKQRETPLPDFLATQDQQRKVAAGGLIAGLVLIVNPWNTGIPIEVLGTLFVLASGAIFLYPDRVFEAIFPERILHREFLNGSAVVEQSGSVRYVPGDDRDSVSFDAFEDTSTKRQQALTYAELDQAYEDGVPVVPQGSIPTAVASAGEQYIAAYRFAVHDEEPERIAAEMQRSQKDVVADIAEFAHLSTGNSVL
ncbi:restriction endonuclease [Haladaptatus sp. ZSTT2]|uniref:restriction endonuclease n=1 Tax=Haladaptatus sp. ZSTT2 TaxID=3120515 RepID=UPI00300EE5FF